MTQQRRLVRLADFWKYQKRVVSMTKELSERSSKLLKALDEKAADYTTDKDKFAWITARKHIIRGRGEAVLIQRLFTVTIIIMEAIYKLGDLRSCFGKGRNCQTCIT